MSTLVPFISVPIREFLPFDLLLAVECRPTFTLMLLRLPKKSAKQIFFGFELSFGFLLVVIVVVTIVVVVLTSGAYDKSSSLSEPRST